MKFRGLVSTGLFAMLSAVLAAPASAQTTVPANDAVAFIGNWDIAVDAGMPVTIKVDISNDNGDVAAVVTGMEGTVTKVEEISKSAEALVLKYTASLQGQPVPVAITLTPEANSG